MPGGQLRHRIDVVVLDDVDDGSGGTTTTERTVVSNWPAAVQPSPPTWRLARIVGGAIDERAWCLITCRYHPAINEGAVVRYRAQRWTVRGLENWQALDRWLMLACDALVVAHG